MSSAWLKSSSCSALACLENTLKFAPPATSEAPSGKLFPGSTALALIASVYASTMTGFCQPPGDATLSTSLGPHVPDSYR
jgi:hypothetical protein